MCSNRHRVDSSCLCCRDIVDVPIRGEVKVIIPFTNPLIVGRFVYHCHILSHEDKGMMATIEVIP